MIETANTLAYYRQSNFKLQPTKYDTTTLLITALHIMTILITLNVADITHKTITYNWFYLLQQINNIYVMSNVLML